MDRWTAEKKRSYARAILVILLLRERAVSFQITVLKVLAGHPGGFASIADLTHYVSILMSSGSDWSNRMKRLATSVPQLDIFSSAFVTRQKDGWRITDAGRHFLTTLEAQMPITSNNGHHLDHHVGTAPLKRAPKLQLVVDNTQVAATSAGPDKLSA